MFAEITKRDSYCITSGITRILLLQRMDDTRANNTPDKYRMNVIAR